MNYFFSKKIIKNFIKNNFFQKSKKNNKKIIKVLIKINKETKYSFFKLTDTFNNFFQKKNVFVKKNHFFVYYLVLYGIIFHKELKLKQEFFFLLTKILSFNPNLKVKTKKVNIVFKHQKKLSFFSYLNYYLQVFSSLNIQIITSVSFQDKYYCLIYLSLLFIYIGFFHKYLVLQKNYDYVVFLLEIIKKIIKYSKKINLFYYNIYLKKLNSFLPKI